MKSIKKITDTTVEELDNQIQELKNLPTTPKVLTLNLVDTCGDFSLLSNSLDELRKNKIKLHVTATGNISGAGIILLAAGTRGKRVCISSATLSFDNHKTDNKTQDLINVLETVNKIDRNNLLQSLNSEGVLNTNQIQLLKLCDCITFGGKKIPNPLIPKKATKKSSKKTTQQNDVNAEVNKA